jgi:integrase
VSVPQSPPDAWNFLILTVARAGEARGARWDEVDLGAAVWTIPAARMKAAREHRVPLSTTARAILNEMEPLRDGNYVFPGQRPHQPLSFTALEKVLRRMNCEGVTVHGFRSTFRDWAGNRTHYPREIAEHALAHAIGDKAEQAHRRDDALERRRPMMEEWADFCGRPSEARNVVQFGRGNRVSDGL